MGQGAGGDGRKLVEGTESRERLGEVSIRVREHEK